MKLVHFTSSAKTGIARGSGWNHAVSTHSGFPRERHFQCSRFGMAFASHPKWTARTMSQNDGPPVAHGELSISPAAPCLESLAGWAEVRVDASHQVIEVKPSVRAFSIRDRLRAAPPFQTLEIFCGGGTLSAAIATHPDFQLVAGVEVEAKFADVWQASHQAATLFKPTFGASIHRNIPRMMSS